MHGRPQAKPDELQLPAATISQPDVDSAIVWAESAYRNCDVCAEKCHVDRISGPAGRCGLGADAFIYKEYLHLGEERLFVPGHAIYMSGCNLRCVFCSDDTAVRRPLETGVNISPRALAARIAQRRTEGATNVNFVGGVPDVNVLYILRTLRHVAADTHVVWNTNLWSTPQAIDCMKPIVGTWLVDYKFGNDNCARRLAAIRDHDLTFKHLFNHLARPATRLPIDASTPFIFVRHLLMPGHFDCCTRPALGWLAANHPTIPVNLMTGYHPYRMARAANAMRGPVPPAETRAAIAWFRALPLRHPHVDGLPVVSTSNRE